MPRTRRTAAALLASLCLTMAACSSDATDTATITSTTTPGSPTDLALSGEVVVFAASSLTEAFTEIGSAFSARYPGVTVTFNFAGSGDLVTQITQGAPADVFVSADDANMSKLTDAGEAGNPPMIIARNSMEIIVEAGNPLGIATVADLAEPDTIVVLCADTVPCGKNAATVLANAAVTLTPASLEDKVKGVVTKVTTGEADAGIVFVTDVLAAGPAAAGVEIPAAINVISNYPMALTAESPNPEAARAFIDFVVSAPGQAILAESGFLAP